MILRFVGQNGDYKLINGLVYPCKIYTKDNFVWVRVRSYAFKFPKKYVYIPYNSIEHMCSEWQTTRL